MLLSSCLSVLLLSAGALAKGQISEFPAYDTHCKQEADRSSALSIGDDKCTQFHIDNGFSNIGT